jgi:hypothetical protein
MRLETSTSNNEMDEVRAVKTRRRKKMVETTTVPGNLENKIGRVLKTRPAPAWGSKPKVKIIGKIIRAEKRETRTVILLTISPVFGMSSVDFI